MTDGQAGRKTDRQTYREYIITIHYTVLRQLTAFTKTFVDAFVLLVKVNTLLCNNVSKVGRPSSKNIAVTLLYRVAQKK